MEPGTKATLTGMGGGPCEVVRVVYTANGIAYYVRVRMTRGGMERTVSVDRLRITPEPTALGGDYVPDAADMLAESNRSLTLATEDMLPRELVVAAPSSRAAALVHEALNPWARPIRQREPRLVSGGVALMGTRGPKGVTLADVDAGAVRGMARCRWDALHADDMSRMRAAEVAAEALSYARGTWVVAVVDDIVEATRTLYPAGDIATCAERGDIVALSLLAAQCRLSLESGEPVTAAEVAALGGLSRSPVPRALAAAGVAAMGGRPGRWDAAGVRAWLAGRGVVV